MSDEHAHDEQGQGASRRSSVEKNQNAKKPRTPNWEKQLGKWEKELLKELRVKN